MEQIMLLFTTFFLLLAHCEAQMNTDFCKKYLPAPTDELAMDPALIVDASVFIEETVENRVIEDQITVSRTDQKVRYKQYSKGKEKDFYAVLDNDLLIENVKFDGQDANCTSSPLEGSNFAEYYNILDVKNTLTFTGLESMLSFTKAGPSIFEAETTARGLSVKHWRKCLWLNNDYAKNITFATDIYYSDKKIMPGNSGDALVRVRQNVIDTNGVIYKRQFDYFNYHDTVPNHLKDFSLPLDMYCKNRPDVISMPHLPFIFQFSMEQINLGDPNDLSGSFTPRFFFYKDKYIYPFTYADKVSTSGNRFVWLQDFEAGLEYELNQLTGVCTVMNIDFVNSAYDKTSHGKVQLKRPEEVLEMNIHAYHYMGQHTFYDRQIDTDVYTSIIKNDATTIIQDTVYFATKNWMSQYGFSDYYPLVITTKTLMNENGTIDERRADIFQFARDASLLNYFDLTVCFNESKQMFLNIHTDLDFKTLRDSDLKNFNDAIFDFIITNTTIVGSSRIANPEVEIGDGGKTDFRFTLLDTSNYNNLDNSQQPVAHQVTNDVIYNELEARINNGTFKFHVKLRTITFTARATGITKGYSNQDTFTARQARATAQQDLFSGGAMGGLAVGMLLVGLLLGFGGFKGVKRITSPSDTDMAMKTLG